MIRGPRFFYLPRETVFEGACVMGLVADSLLGIFPDRSDFTRNCSASAGPALLTIGPGCRVMGYHAFPFESGTVLII